MKDKKLLIDYRYASYQSKKPNKLPLFLKEIAFN